MARRRRGGFCRRGRRGTRALFERLEPRTVLDGAGPRPFIDLGPSDNVALDQPRVTVEFGDAAGRSIGPDIFNSWLLDTGANTVLAFQTAIDDMNGSPPNYQVEGLFEEIGVGGSQLFDISAPYQFDFAGASGVRQTLSQTRIISDATRDVSMFGPFGIVGMPAMAGRVTTLDFTPWLSFGEGNFLMACDFGADLPAAAGSRYTVSVDDRVSFSPDGQVIEGDFPPVWSDVPFFSAEVEQGSRVVPGNFMFDTGAQVSIISTATALALGLDTNADGLLDATDAGYARAESVGGVGGSREAPVFMIDAVHLPTDEGVDLVWHDLQWLVADIAPGIDGVFGFDNVTTGWIDAVFSSGGSGAMRQVQLDFRDWDATGKGKIAFDVSPDLAAVQLPEGAGAVIVEPGGVTTVSESGVEDSYTIALRTRPAADVIVDLVTPASQLTAFPSANPGASSLRFTPDDWSVPQRVTVRAVDDATQQSLHRSSVRHVPTSADPAYDGVGLPRVLVNIVDNDYAAVMILPTEGETDVVEGGADDTYSLVLARAPSQEVRIDLAPADGQVTAVAAATGATSLLFTPSNWNVPQAVRVTAVDDAVAEGPVRTMINHVVDSGDPEYAEAYVLPELVFVTDDDAAARAPLLAASSAAVQGVIGGTLAGSGTWSAPDAGHAVTLTATLGTVVQSDDGTWNWSLSAVTPLGREPVTITATDDRGLATTVSIAVTARGAPTDARATPGDRSAALAWTAPPAVPGLPVTGYRLERSGDDGATWTPLPDLPAASPSATCDGLVNGAAYRFRTAAIDADGVGPWSEASAPVTPRTVPAAAAAPTATRGVGQATLAWKAPASDGGAAITDYTVQSSQDGGTTWTTFPHAVSTATTITVTGLPNGVSHLFRVAAVNVAGAGNFSDPSTPVVPGRVAAAPAPPTATRGVGQVTLAWKPPASDGGLPITDYVVRQSADGGVTWTTVADQVSTATTAVVSGLANGTSYLFRVAAVTAVGRGYLSTDSAPVVPATLAGAPQALAATPGSGAMTLSWKAPASDGGAAVVDYAILWSDDDGRSWKAFAHPATTATAATIAGLPSAVAIRFRVAAVNSVGTGPASEVTATPR